MTTQTKLQFFACNIGQKAQIKGTTFNTIIKKIDGVDESINVTNVNNISVIKTPLDKMTVDHKILLAKAIGEVVEHDFIYWAEYYLNKYINRYSESMYFGIADTIRVFIHEYGYADSFTTIENGKPVTYTVQDQIDNNLIILK